MFLSISKAAEGFLSPLTWALLLAAAAVLLRRRPRAAWTLAAAAAGVLVAFSTDPVADGLQRAAERGARRTYRPGATYDAVVVLGGMVDAGASRASGETELTEAADRIVRGVELVRTGHARALLLSGGNVYPVPGDPAEADRLAALAAALGVPPDRLVAEAASRNTRENAVEAARVAAARGWRTLLVVTSAAHAPRALGCFRAVGLEPDVLPVDHRAGDAAGRFWLPRPESLVKSTRAIREVVGRLAYRAAGYTR